MTEILEGYISRPKLAKQLGKSVRCIERWGILQIGPPIKLGRQPFYRIDSVREWLASREERQPRSRANTAA
jgi:hypothetical protein